MQTFNNDIREAAEAANIYLWEIAVKLGLNDGNFSRKLRRELTQAEKERIFSIIEQLKKERDGEQS